jgi:hypothetical protein
VNRTSHLAWAKLPILRVQNFPPDPVEDKSKRGIGSKVSADAVQK